MTEGERLHGVRLIREVTRAGKSGPFNGQYALQKALAARRPQWLKIGGLLAPGRAYRVESQLKHEGLQKGVFAFSMYCFDGEGRSLKQIVFRGLNTNSPPHDWRRVRGEFGPGTRNPLPTRHGASRSASPSTRPAVTAKARFWSTT